MFVNKVCAHIIVHSESSVLISTDKFKTTPFLSIGS